MKSDQYITGAFKSIEVSGQDKNRMYFSEEISPETIRNAGDSDVRLIGQLPQDDMSRMSMAQIAREGQTPHLPDRFIRDEILGMQSADQMDDSINSQMAERMLPEAALWTMYKSAVQEGREDVAVFYEQEIRRILLEKSMQQPQMPPPPQMPQQGMPMMPPPSQLGPQGPPGLPPQVMPNAGLGIPPVTPTAPVGPAVPAGTPRPGAQSSASRLADLGLIPSAPGG